MVKKIYIDGDCYGQIGKLVPKSKHKLDCDVYVGDILVYHHNGKVHSGLVLNEEYANTYGIYGHWYKCLSFDKVVKLIDYSETDDDDKILYISSRSEVTIEDDKEVEMTIEQIQRILGHKVKIIK